MKYRHMRTDIRRSPLPRLAGTRAFACGALANVFAAGDVDDLLAAVEAARAAPRDLVAAARLARRHEWGAAFDAELADLGALVR